MNLPSAFIERTSLLMGEKDFSALEAALQSDAPVSVRLHPSKGEGDLGSICKSLAEGEGERIPWSSAGIYLPKRPTFTLDPLLHAGCYYVQEASSMFVEQALRRFVREPVTMLDLCAAPGGKSTLARAVLPEGSLLVANEVVRTRAQVLTENLVKWGHPDVVVTSNDPADFGSLTGLFDVILADVPCSGEGMFRKDPTAIEEWSEDHVQMCWQRQRRILADVWPALKPGGLLIYSTCTYNAEENEDNVAWMASEWGAEPLEIPAPAEWGITGDLTGRGLPVYRFLPHRTRGEGFFLAAMRKTGEATSERGTASEAKPTKQGKVLAKQQRALRGKSVPKMPAEVKTWLQDADAFEWQTDGSRIVAFPAQHLPHYDRLRQKLRILHAGITIGELKGKDILPHHSLAMSTALCRGAFPQAALDYEQAIAYLRREAVTLSPTVPRGYILLTYRDIPLGFAKNIGNRANNLYPAEWRIRNLRL